MEKYTISITLIISLYRFEQFKDGWHYENPHFPHLENLIPILEERSERFSIFLRINVNVNVDHGKNSLRSTCTREYLFDSRPYRETYRKRIRFVGFYGSMDGFVKGDASSLRTASKRSRWSRLSINRRTCARMTGRTPINQHRDKRPGDTARWREVAGPTHELIRGKSTADLWKSCPRQMVDNGRFAFHFFFFLRNESIHPDLLLSFFPRF